MARTYRALVVDKRDDAFSAEIRDLDRETLPDGDVLVRVAYSTLNYKDGLAVTNSGPIIRNFPMVPGIDFAGTVEESSSPEFKPGDRVVLNGWGVGERHPGGFAQIARAKAGWLVPLPPGIDERRAMAIGTAGFTAMLSVMALDAHGVRPGGREVCVTGAAGGVGSVAVAVLATLGYRVVASTGRADTQGDYLTGLGAAELIDRQVLSTPSKRPLESERWGGAVDTVGGDTLANLLRQTAYRGAVAACGLAGGTSLNTSVHPFILRGVNLLGIDSVMCPAPLRREAWQRLARDLPADRLDRMTEVVPLADVTRLAADILRGAVRGRVVVDVNA